jgi:hypothetical protein
MQAVYYRAADGAEPVDAFIEALRDPAKQAALDNQIERLNLSVRTTRRCRFPGARSSRASCGSFAATTAPSSTGCSIAARATCSCCCTCFAKDTGKVPEAELRVARERWDDFKARMDAERRRPPRAAGHDAP